MNIFYRLGKHPVALFITAQALVLLAFIAKDFPVFIFLAFAPMFALVDHPSSVKDFVLPFLVAVLTAFIFYSFRPPSPQQNNVLSWIIYFSSLAAVFTAYVLMQRWTSNRLNKFALIFFILGFEYILLKTMVDLNPVFLADLLKHKASWTRWNIFTGYTGATVWILLSNLLFYHALFKDERVNVGLCIVALVVVVGPIIYSLRIPGTGLANSDAVNLYSGQGTPYPAYSEHGEFISRTGAWVSLLILIFTVIKGMTKKKASR